MVLDESSSYPTKYVIQRCNFGHESLMKYIKSNIPKNMMRNNLFECCNFIDAYPDIFE